MCSSQPLLRAGELLQRQAALLELLAGQSEVGAGGIDAGVAQDLRGQRQAGARLDEPCPCGAPQGMEGLAVVGHMLDAGPGQAAAHEGRAAKVRLAMASMGKPDTKVNELCKEL